MTSNALSGEAAPAVARTGLGLPALVEATGERSARHFIDFFTATVRNANTKLAYYRAVTQFLPVCEAAGFGDLKGVRTWDIAEYCEAWGARLMQLIS